jgi:hypothetical protein
MKIDLSSAMSDDAKQTFDASEKQFEKASQKAVARASAIRPEKRKWTERLKFWKKRKSVTRRHKRYDCCIVAQMTLTERDVTLDGVVMEMSCGGLLFRVASHYILDRSGQQVSVNLDNLVVPGRIMNTSSLGYGIKVFTEIDEEDVLHLVGKYGLHEAA